jgi:acyl carrier protein
MTTYLTDTENVLGKIWSELLQIGTVGPEEEFLALGGNSLKALRMAREIKNHFKVQIPLTQLTGNLTIKKLGVRLDELMAGAILRPSHAASQESGEL